MTNFTIIKQDHLGAEVIRYPGRALSQRPHAIVLEAFFNFEFVEEAGLSMRRGDRFVETFYSDRWYNLFEVHDAEDGHLKGWYGNVGHPAKIKDQIVSYKDLALDVVALPNGQVSILDETEFRALGLPPDIEAAAHRGLNELLDQINQLLP